MKKCVFCLNPDPYWKPIWIPTYGSEKTIRYRYGFETLFQASLYGTYGIYGTYFGCGVKVRYLHNTGQAGNVDALAHVPVLEEPLLGHVGLLEVHAQLQILVHDLLDELLAVVVVPLL